MPMSKVPFVVTIFTCGYLCSGTAQARSEVQRDVEGYAIATCLTKQSEPYLKDQGDAWASVIVQRSHGDLDPFHAVQEAVEAELKKGFVPAVPNEQDPKHSKLVPVLYCAEIIDEPSVRPAIDKAIKKLTPAYRRAKK